VVGRYNYRYAVNAFIRSDESIHGVAVVIPTNHCEIPGSTPGRYNLQIEITSECSTKKLVVAQRLLPGPSPSAGLLKSRKNTIPSYSFPPLIDFSFLLLVLSPRPSLNKYIEIQAQRQGRAGADYHQQLGYRGHTSWVTVKLNWMLMWKPITLH